MGDRIKPESVIGMGQNMQLGTGKVCFYTDAHHRSEI